MRILFVQNNPLDESQALIELAGWLKAHGHGCGLVMDREEEALLSVAGAFRPDLVLVAASVLNHAWACDVARRMRPLGVPIAVGGTAPTIYPTLIEKGAFDWVIQGEAETPVLGLLAAMEAGRAPDGVPGLFRWESGGLVGTGAAPGVGLGELPAADKDLYYARYPFMRDFPFKRFLTSRGCHHRCTYCYIPALNKVQPRGEGRRWTRRKSPEQAVDEVAREKAKGPLSHVHFSDDLFTSDSDWLSAFAPLYRRRIGVPFTCNTSAELIDDQVAAALAEAGCHAAGFAVETASARLRLKVLRKGVTEDHMRAAAERLRAHGVGLATFNMLALPGETPEEALGTALLNAELGTRYVRLNFAFPMPGTGMFDYAMAEGFLAPEWPERFAAADFRYRPGPQFITPHRREFENLFVLFRTVAAERRTLPMVRRALRSKAVSLAHRALTLQGAWNEKRTFRIPVMAGLQFFAKVGRPELRATNFPALI